jgi:ATP phosphoribosyltransferase
MLLQAALHARGKVGLMLNVHERSLAAVEALLPSLRSPTVAKLQTEGWFSVSTIVDEETVRELLPRLKEAGAEGIVEFPLNKIVD